MSGTVLGPAKLIQFLNYRRALIAGRYAVCFVSRQRELDRVCEALNGNGREEFDALVVGEVIPTLRRRSDSIISRPKVLGSGKRFYSFQVRSPIVGLTIDPLSTRDTQAIVRMLSKDFGPPHLVVVTAQWGWRGLFWSQLSRSFSARIAFVPEGIGVFLADPFVTLGLRKSARRYLGQLRDTTVRGFQERRPGRIADTVHEIFRLAVRVVRLSVFGARRPAQRSDFTCDVLYSSWGEIVLPPPHVTARRLVVVRGDLRPSDRRRRSAREGCLLLCSPIPSPETAWPAVIAAIARRGVRHLAIKPHPAHNVDSLLSAVERSQILVSYEVLPSSVPAEQLLDAFRWDLVVGIYSTSLYYAAVNFPRDNVLTGCELIISAVPTRCRPEAEVRARQFLEEVGSHMPGPPIGRL